MEAVAAGLKVRDAPVGDDRALKALDGLLSVSHRILGAIEALKSQRVTLTMEPVTAALREILAEVVAQRPGLGSGVPWPAPMDCGCSAYTQALLCPQPHCPRRIVPHSGLGQ